MTYKEIQEGNKLVAEFMEVEKCKRCDPWCGGYQYNPGVYYLPDKMKYHSSWDWLMYVVEKIGNTPNINVNISSFDGCVIYDDDYKNTARGMRINKKGNLLNSVWFAVVEFIKWYNQNKDHDKNKIN